MYVITLVLNEKRRSVTGKISYETYYLLYETQINECILMDEHTLLDRYLNKQIRVHNIRENTNNLGYTHISELGNVIHCEVNSISYNLNVINRRMFSHNYVTVIIPNCTSIAQDMKGVTFLIPTEKTPKQKLNTNFIDSNGVRTPYNLEQTFFNGIISNVKVINNTIQLSIIKLNGYSEDALAYSIKKSIEEELKENLKYIRIHNSKTDTYIDNLEKKSLMLGYSDYKIIYATKAREKILLYENYPLMLNKFNELGYSQTKKLINELIGDKIEVIKITREQLCSMKYNAWIDDLGHDDLITQNKIDFLITQERIQVIK